LPSNITAEQTWSPESFGAADVGWNVVELGLLQSYPTNDEHQVFLSSDCYSVNRRDCILSSLYSTFRRQAEQNDGKPSTSSKLNIHGVVNSDNDKVLD